MMVVVAAQWQGYSSGSQTISELSAIGAPTRVLWTRLAILYTLLVTAFGWGVWMSAGRTGTLRVAGGLLFVYGALGVGWHFAPMHLRDVLAAGGGTLSDTMHLVLASVTVVLMLLAIGFGAAALDPWFRRYSIASLVILGACGALTFREAPRIAANLAHAVDRRLGAHQRRRVPALGRGAGSDALAPGPAAAADERGRAGRRR